MKTGWEWKRLAEVCEFFADGDWIESKDQAPRGIRLVQTGNVGEGYFKDRSEKCRYISDDTFARLRCTEIYEGDCLISRLPDPVGRSCRLPKTGERMITAVDCTIARFDKEVCLPEFFNLYSQSGHYLAEVARKCTGTTRSRISRNNLGAVKIPIPPLPEQQRIVRILDEAFAGLATAEANAARNLQNAREIFDSHLHAVFSQRGEGWVERRLEAAVIKTGWEWKTLDQIATNLDSQRVPITKAARVGGNYPYYGASGIVDYVADYIFEGDALLISEDGANLLARSTPIAFPASGKYWVNNHAHVLRFENMATQRFVEYFLESIPLDQYVTGAAQPKLNQRALNSIPIPTPPLSEQQRIVEELTALQSHTNSLRRLFERKQFMCAELKKSLLHEAFSGML